MYASCISCLAEAVEEKCRWTWDKRCFGAVEEFRREDIVIRAVRKDIMVQGNGIKTQKRRGRRKRCLRRRRKGCSRLRKPLRLSSAYEGRGKAGQGSQSPRANMGLTLAIAGRWLGRWSAVHACSCISSLSTPDPNTGLSFLHQIPAIDHQPSPSPSPLLSLD